MLTNEPEMIGPKPASEETNQPRSKKGQQGNQIVHHHMSHNLRNESLSFAIGCPSLVKPVTNSANSSADKCANALANCASSTLFPLSFDNRPQLFTVLNIHRLRLNYHGL